ncbi:MAG: thioredoxin-dependent thiol peroxidase [Ferruginibacter sp.]
MTALTEGSKAPAFKGKDQNGSLHSLANYKGQKLIIYFYPRDNTATCTQQACNLRDNFSLLKKNGFVVLGVSPDPIPKHKKFAETHQLPFALLSDPDHQIIDKYGVWGEKKLYGKKYMGLLRTSFIIDEKGLIQKIFLKPKSKIHATEILEAWALLKKKKYIF